VVRPGQLEFWHVAGHTFFCGHRTRFRTQFTAAMTGLAFRVVIDEFAAHFVVRVMAREAANPRRSTCYPSGGKAGSECL